MHVKLVLSNQNETGFKNRSAPRVMSKTCSKSRISLVSLLTRVIPQTYQLSFSLVLYSPREAFCVFVCVS